MSFWCPGGPIALSQITIKGNTCGRFGQLSIRKKFENKSDGVVGTTFKFPFPVQLGRLTDIIVKRKAKKFSGELKSLAILQGLGVTKEYETYTNEMEGDVIYIKIENLQPKEEIFVTIQFITKLKNQGNILRLVIPTYLALINEDEEEEERTIQPWNLEVNMEVVASGGEVAKVESPTHSIETDLYQNTRTVKYSERGVTLKGDIVLHVMYESACKTREIITTALSFTPGTETYAALFQLVPPATDLQMRELIFIIDCSISMSGSRLFHLKNALANTLTSLPKGCYFNVYTFSGNFRRVFATSVLVADAEIAQARKFVEELSAELGIKKNVLAALNEIYSSPLVSSHPRHLYIFTDGKVDKQQKVLALIKKEVENTKVFSLGLGNRSVHSSAFQLAKAGEGLHMFVSGNETMMSTIQPLVRTSLQLHSAQLETTGFDLVSRSPAQIKDVFGAVPFSVMGFIPMLPEQAKGDELVLKTTKETLCRLPVSKAQLSAEYGNLVERIAAYSLINENTLPPEELIRLSATYHVASAQTSFHLQDEEVQVLSFPIRDDVPVDEEPIPAPQGKKIYDYNFVAQFRPFLTEIPEQLLNYDFSGMLINNNNSNNNKNNNAKQDHGKGRRNDKGGGQRGGRGGHRGGRGGGGDRSHGHEKSGGHGGQNAGEKKAAPGSPAPLIPTDNRWKRPNRSVNGENDKKDKILLEVQGILNKLTLDKFDKLSKKLIEIEVPSLDILQGMIKLIFDKALTEQKYATMYAELCLRLARYSPKFDIEKNNTLTFKRILLNNCQQEFENAARTDLPEGNSDRQELEFRVRKRSLGNIRFIGELFKLGMLTDKIMFGCIEKLLRLSHENGLEGLCQLLTTIGKSLEERDLAQMKTYFTQILTLSEDKKLTSRIRFMLQDLLDLRKNNWVPRRKDDDPKLIAELHKEAEMEEARNEAAFRSTLPPSRRGEGPPSKRGGGGGAARAPGTPTKGGQIAEVRDTPPPKPSRQEIEKASPVPVDQGWEVAKSSKPKGGKHQPNTLPSPQKGWKNDKGKDAENPKGQEGRNVYNMLEGKASTPQKQAGRGRGGGRGGGPNRSPAKQEKTRKDNQSPSPNLSRASNLSPNAAPFTPLSSVGTSPMQPLSPKAAEVSSQNETEPLASAPAPAPSLPDAVKQAEVKPDAPRDTQVDQVQEKIERLIEEYFACEEPEEAGLCVQDLNCAELHYEVVNRGIYMSIERREREVSLMMKLFNYLHRENILQASDFVKGFNKILEYLDEISIDIPYAPTYVARFLSQALHDGDITLSFFNQNPSLQAGKEEGKSLSLVLDVLNLAYTVNSNKFQEGIMKSGNVDLNSFIPNEKQADYLLEQISKKNADLLPFLLPEKQ